MILAGDVGGTSTRLAAYELSGNRLRALAREDYASQAHADLGAMLARFLAGQPFAIARTCFGVAGPVRRRCATLPNLPWDIDAARLERNLALGPVDLINDLEAIGYGIAALEPADFATLNTGEPGAAGNAAVIAAGTGLGEAGLYWDGARHRPFAGEGGHADFAPRDELEADLLRYLLRHFERVSWERVVSGPGLVLIYEFLRDSGRGTEDAAVAAALRAGDAPAAIARAALDGRCALCARALDLLISLYGAEAGNLALKVLALGGVYVGGGIAPKILPRLADGTFMRAFTAKGRMRPLLEAMPVRVILNPDAGLLGAARFAALQSAPAG